jgi:protein-L-isoaspartate(D-aspartate) O-methyltransferase
MMLLRGIRPAHFAASNRYVAMVAIVATLLMAACSRAYAAGDFVEQRNHMVDEEIVAAGVKDKRVIQALRDTPRHAFVAQASRQNAYLDMALPIGNGQTISPPFVVAYMTEQLHPQSSDKVLEIGTGSGYQAAVLSPLVKEVYTIEIVKPLGERAARSLKRLKYANVFAKVGDGYQGWPEHAPFDKIIVTCSPERVPPKLVEQLREGGRMIVPVGERYEQTLYLFQKRDGKLIKEALLPTLFVPMTGTAESTRVEKPDPTRPSINNGGFERLASEVKDAEEKPDAAQPPENKPVAGKPSASGQSSSSAEATEDDSPTGWHYQRPLKIEEAKDAPEGSHFVTFTNREPGRGAHALQGLAVDGRKVDALKFSLWVKTSGVQGGEKVEQQPMVAITFYDENRAPAGFTWVGPWRDTFPWQHVTDTVRVPTKAREAIIRIGLGGATGEVSFDDLRVEAVR